MSVASKMTYVYFAALSVLGVAFHAMQKVMKHYHLVDYVEAPKRPKRKKNSLEKKASFDRVSSRSSFDEEGNPI